MVSGNYARVERAGLRIDRVVAAVAITALTLSVLIAAQFLSATHSDSFAGLRLLAPDDHLVTFEDFELGAQGWSLSQTDQTSPGFGGVLGRFGGTGGEETVSRVYDIPADANYAVVTFDLHAIDDWSLDDIMIFANGIEVVRRNFGPTGQERSLIVDQPWVTADLSLGDRHGVERGFGASGDQTLAVRIILTRPPEQLRLGFGANLESDAASWAIDNLQIVATMSDPLA